MKKLEIGDWQQRPYGERAEGVATVGKHTVAVTVRRPDNYHVDGQQVVMANGWTTGKNSMRQAAIQAVQHGHTAYTMDYTNHSHRDALKRNTDDLATVVDALPGAARIRLMGLSMGGAVTTAALERVGNRVEHVDLVASGRYLLPEYYSKKEIVRHLLGQSTEAVRHHGRFGDDIRLFGASLANCVQRPFAVIGEFLELVDGNVHEELWRVKAQPDAPTIYFRYGMSDRLLPPEAQVKSVEGLPFDAVLPYAGGHDWLARSPALAREIFAQTADELVA